MKKLYTYLILFFCLVVASVTAYFGIPFYKEKFKRQEITQEKAEVKKSEEKIEILQTRQGIMAYLEKNINNFAPYLSQNLEKWRITRFGFVDDENIYAELEDSHNLLKILLRCKKVEEDFDCRNIANFEPENFQWKVGQGENPFDNKNIYYYEKEIGTWKFKGTSEELVFFPMSRDSLLEIQKTVDQGYLNWRRDPVSILRHDLPKDLNFDINRDKFKPISRNEKEGKITYQIIFQTGTWNVVLTQPVKKDEGGVWVIEEMSKVK